MLRYLSDAFIGLRVVSAMFRLHVMNPANIFIFAGQFPQLLVLVQLAGRSHVNQQLGDRVDAVTSNARDRAKAIPLNQQGKDSGAVL